MDLGLSTHLTNKHAISGDIHFLTKFALVISVIVMLFISITVKCFLSRPVPYRPLTKEYRFPCDPDDYKAKLEAEGKTYDPEAGLKLEKEGSSNIQPE